jgi:hypothetical protein
VSAHWAGTPCTPRRLISPTARGPSNIPGGADGTTALEPIGVTTTEEAPGGVTSMPVRSARHPGEQKLPCRWEGNLLVELSQLGS